MAKKKDILGIDIGGSGIKGALVDVEKGELTTERYRIPTPQPSTPEAVAQVVTEIIEQFDYQGPVGVTFPAIVKNGVTMSAANVDKSWIGADADALFERVTGMTVHMINDADAAGVAEVTFGAGKDKKGLVMMLTLGTGIGSGMFLDAKLIPNSELGHLELNGKEVEPWASAKAREDKGLSYKKWAKRLEKYFRHLEFIFSPELFIIGGGISKKSDKFLPRIKTSVPIVPAQFRNEAGIIGAAYWISQQVEGLSAPKPAQKRGTRRKAAGKTRTAKTAAKTGAQTRRAKTTATQAKTATKATRQKSSSASKASTSGTKTKRPAQATKTAKPAGGSSSRKTSARKANTRRRSTKSTGKAKGAKQSDA